MVQGDRKVFFRNWRVGGGPGRGGVVEIIETSNWVNLPNSFGHFHEENGLYI